MNSHDKAALNEFGNRIVAEVFDRTCEHLKNAMPHGVRGTKPDPLHLAYQSLHENSASVLRRYLIVAVDQTFAQFLIFFRCSRHPDSFSDKERRFSRRAEIK